VAEISKQAAADIVQSSAEGKELAAAASRMLGELLPRIEKTKDLVQGITASSEEQSSGAAQVNTAVQQLDRVLQQNASASQQMAATAGSLSELGAELQQAVAFFRLADGQPAAGRGAAPVRLRTSPAREGPARRATRQDGNHALSDDPANRDFKKY
jgi:methyl-accepting chemotaxis protein